MLNLKKPIFIKSRTKPWKSVICTEIKIGVQLYFDFEYSIIKKIKTTVTLSVLDYAELIA